MKKQLLASLLSLFLVAGLAPFASSATTDSATASCPGSKVGCPMDQDSSSAYKVLTKEECQRFCKAKAAAIAKDPSLAKPENKRKLCRAIVQADPSMKPICMKLRKNCRKMKKHCMNSACSEKVSGATPEQSSSSSQQSADASSSSSSMSSSVASQSASASGAQQSSSSATSAN